MLRAAASAALLAGLSLWGCQAPPARDPFAASGHVIAMSGADAGAARACFLCHGLAGDGDGGLVPALAGLPVGYLQKQLEDYAAGRRPDAVMSPIAQALAAGERRAVARYYADLPAPPRSAAPGDAPAAAAALYQGGDARRGLAPCAGCHGGSAQGIGAANPPLAGQPPAYLAEQLRRWREARRRNDPTSAMLKAGQRLTAEEIEALAGYAAGLGAPAARPSGSPAASP